ASSLHRGRSAPRLPWASPLRDRAPSCFCSHQTHSCHPVLPALTEIITYAKTYVRAPRKSIPKSRPSLAVLLNLFSKNMAMTGLASVWREEITLLSPLLERIRSLASLLA